LPDLVAPKSGGVYEQQFRNIVDNSLDRRKFVDVSFGTAGDELTIEHGLGYIPVGFIVINANIAMSVFSTGTPWDTESIYLQANQDNAHARIMIF